jgi:hypothetical protein
MTQSTHAKGPARSQKLLCVPMSYERAPGIRQRREWHGNPPHPMRMDVTAHETRRMCL